MKKYIFMWLWLPILLTGCMSSVTELENRSFVMAMGIDSLEGGLEVTYSFPDLEALIGTGSNVHKPVITIQAKDLKTAELIFDQRTDKPLDYGQLKVIVFGENMEEDRLRVKGIIDELKEDQRFARTIYMAKANGSAKELIQKDEDIEGAIGLYLDGQIRQQEKRGMIETVSLNDKILDYQIELPIVEVQ